MLYFAYGANLDATQMRLKCAEARYVGKGRLDDYRICFPVWSRIRQSWLVGIEPAAGERVWGGLYELGEAELTRLDHREGYDAMRRPSRNTFNRVTVTVARGQGRSSQAETYVAKSGSDINQPSADYLAYLVHLAGARGLPEEYQSRLKGMRQTPLAA
jgi:gamma-glutamylcyclotransferase (GGCT)/AIG2-like uncharacterized protein YtfP